MLLAVHISDGVLTVPWLAGGFVVGALLLWNGSRRIRDEEVPRIAILTAAFFVSSLIHLRVGPTSIHLLLNGLLGVLLGPRAALAVFVGLLLQVLLIGHGGFLTLGINTCVMTLPAFFCAILFHGLHHMAWIKTSPGRSFLVSLSAGLWFLSGAYSLTLVCNMPFTELDSTVVATANHMIWNPWLVGVGILFVFGSVVLERKLENDPEFPLGFLIGELSVLLTSLLNCIVLLAGGEEKWPTPPLLLVIAHLPFAVVEGIVLGFVVGFLAKVKPEMLWTAPPASLDLSRPRHMTGVAVAPANLPEALSSEGIAGAPPTVD